MEIEKRLNSVNDDSGERTKVNTIISTGSWVKNSGQSADLHNATDP